MPKVLENPKEAILLFAKEIVIKDGIDNLTMREVSKKSGIAVGTIYNYFPTKKDLTLQLIENYWYEFLSIVEEIDKNYDDLFIKLHEIFNRMDFFVETFKVIWIKNSFSEYTEDGMMRKNIFLDKLTKKIETLLIKEQNRKVISLSMDVNIIANFLILNFMTMAQMKQFKYDNFDKIIKDYFSI